ncbi:hypothetical protein ACXZ1K_13215 [Pedobacter sp. PWIIR3]
MINPEDKKEEVKGSENKTDEKKTSTNSNYDEHMTIDEEGNEVGPDDQI